MPCPSCVQIAHELLGHNEDWHSTEDGLTRDPDPEPATEATAEVDDPTWAEDLLESQPPRRIGPQPPPLLPRRDLTYKT